LRATKPKALIAALNLMMGEILFERHLALSLPYYTLDGENAEPMSFSLRAFSEYLKNVLFIIANARLNRRNEVDCFVRA